MKDIVSVENMAKFRVPHFYLYHINIAENIGFKRKSPAMMSKKIIINIEIRFVLFQIHSSNEILL